MVKKISALSRSTTIDPHANSKYTRTVRQFLLQYRRYSDCDIKVNNRSVYIGNINAILKISADFLEYPVNKFKEDNITHKIILYTTKFKV